MGHPRDPLSLQTPSAAARCCCAVPGVPTDGRAGDRRLPPVRNSQPGGRPGRRGRARPAQPGGISAGLVFKYRAASFWPLEPYRRPKMADGSSAQAIHVHTGSQVCHSVTSAFESEDQVHAPSGTRSLGSSSVSGGLRELIGAPGGIAERSSQQSRPLHAAVGHAPIGAAT